MTFKLHKAFLCFGVAVNIMFAGFYNVSFAQEEVLAPSPSDITLSPPVEARPEVLAPAQDDGDDLPDAEPQRVRFNTEGFSLQADRSTDIFLDDISQPNQEELLQGIREESFESAVTGLFPLSPDQIKELLKVYDKTQEAVQTPVYDIPRPEISVQTISLDPGVVPPTISTAVGHVTTLNILDVTGAPWPIQDVTWAGDFEVTEPEEGGHIIRITPLEQFAYGNISIRLLTLKTPITFSLRAQRDVVQYRVDARIPEFGPFAEAPLIDGGTSIVAGNALLTSILDGVPPSGADRLEVSGVDGRTTAYSINGMVYVRTPLTLLSPGWQSSVSSADGMNVYALNDTPVMVLSDGGRFARAHLKEKEDLFQ